MADYIPNRQDIIYIDFDPSAGKEIQKRRPAVVISDQGYSKLTGYVVPITHVTNNRFVNSNFLVPIQDGKVDGYVNPLQFHTFDYQIRNAKKIGMMNSGSYALVLQTVKNIID